MSVDRASASWPSGKQGQFAAGRTGSPGPWQGRMCWHHTATERERERERELALQGQLKFFICELQ